MYLIAKFSASSKSTEAPSTTIDGQKTALVAKHARRRASDLQATRNATLVPQRLPFSDPFPETAGKYGNGIV